MKKRVLKFFVNAAILFFVIFGLEMSAKAAVEQVEAPTGVTWDSSWPGVISWNGVKGVEGIYSVELYKDGVEYHCTTWSMLVDSKGVYSVNLSELINESGEYSVRVAGCIEENGISINKEFSEFSEAFSYVRPENELGKVNNIQWDSQNVATATWDYVKGAGGYLTIIYKDGFEINRSWGVGPAPYFSDEINQSCCKQKIKYCMYEEGKYKVRVIALSSDITKIANSPISEFSVELDSESISKPVEDTLQNALEQIKEANVTPELLQAVRDDIIYNTNIDAFAISMQTSAQVLSQIIDLESAYVSANSITVSSNVTQEMEQLIDPGKISVVGAGLNATGSGIVELGFSKPIVDENIDATKYKNAIQLDIKLEGTGIVPGATLAIPVRITMPIPSGISLSNLCILHFHSTGEPELLLPIFNNDGTCTFTVTSFSTFAFVNAVNQEIKSSVNTTVSIDNSNVWVPVTAEDKLRYSLVGKEVLEVKATNVESIKVSNSVQGNKYFEVLNRIKGNYTLARTYNIFPNNSTIKNPVYITQTPAIIQMNIPKTLQKENREFKMICITENGIPIVLNDMDQTPNTITIETNHFYAFTLVYLDKE